MTKKEYMAIQNYLMDVIHDSKEFDTISYKILIDIVSSAQAHIRNLYYDKNNEDFEFLTTKNIEDMYLD